MRRVYLTMLLSIIYLTTFGLMANGENENNSTVGYAVAEFSDMEDDVVTCGSISAVRIYDQSTDEPVWAIDPLYNGISIDASQLPNNYYIAVETEGSIGSVAIWLDGNSQSIENASPYTYPNGADNGSNWNGGAGSYDLDAIAYLNDNGDHQCGSVWLAFSIVDGGCDNVTDAGSIQGGFEACANDNFTIINTELPSGGSGSLEYVWLFNPNGPNLSGHSAISNSNAPELTTSNDESGWYRRCARRVGCSDYAGESNWVEVTIGGNCNTIDEPSAPNCEAGAYIWENNIDVNTLNGSSGIPQADLRFVDGNVTQYSIPGPFPSAFNGEVTINSIKAVSWDAYLNRPSTGNQPKEQWRVILRNNGSTVYSSDYTDDLATGVLQAETTTILGTNIDLSGIDEIILAHYEDETYGTSDSPSANSVVPVSICIDFTEGCERIAPTADNLTSNVTIQAGDDFPNVTFSDETSTATVTNYEEYTVAKSCEIDFSSYPAYSNTNIWLHEFLPGYDKHFQWNEGNVLTLEDGTVKLIGRIQNVNDATSGFLLEFYFEQLVDQATFLAAGGYNSTDANAADRLYANVDFTMPNTITGFGDFANADLELLDNGGVHHMDIGERDVYGGYGFGFWIEYGGTINGIPVGNSASTGTNHMDMYSALNTCYESEGACSELIIREWMVEDECENQNIFIQNVNVVGEELSVNNYEEEITVECGDAYPEVTFDNGSVTNYEEYNADKSCKIDLSTYPAYSNTNIWFHSFLPTYTKWHTWNDGHVITLEDGTVKLIGRIENNDDPSAGFIIEFYFEELVDQATFLAAGGYNSTDATAAERLYANVDFSKPNSITGFGAFADADMQLLDNGGMKHMDMGPRDVYGGYGFGFWIEYGGTLNGMDVGNTSNPTGSNHADMYSALNVCYDNDDCQDLVIREWTVEDLCGNMNVYVQHVNVIDTEAPVATDVEDLTVLCDEALPTAEPTFVDACDADLEIIFDESSSINADGLTVITRTWTATDDCGNETESSYTITILACTNVGDTVWYDNDRDGVQDADEIGVAGVTVELIGPGVDGLFHTADDIVIATDETDANGNYLFEGVVPGEYCIQFVESTIPADYIFTAANEGGDDAADSDVDEDGKTESFTVTSGQADDLTWDAGIYTCSDIVLIGGPLEDIIVECGDVIPDPETPNFSDPVDDDLDIVYSETIIPEDCQYKIERTWTATNDCGNTLTVSKIVDIVDTVAPTLSGVPMNTEYECIADLPTPPVVTPDDGCDDNPEVVFAESSDNVDCNEMITRTWTVTDDCDNVTVYTQMITITDETSPLVSSSPADAAIECDEDMPNDLPTFTDNCDDDLTVTMTEVESGNGCPLVITRTWTATDDCGNDVSTSQVITINDTTAPTASNLPQDVSVECSDVLPTDEPSFDDNCDEDLSIDFTEVENPLDCQYEIVRTWTATDDCGNNLSISQTITVTDMTAPTLEGVPMNVSVECIDEVLAPAEPIASDNCDPNPIVTFNETSSVDGCEETLTRVWTVTDNCNNVTSYTQMISIIDETAPVATNVPANETVLCDDDMPTSEPTFTDNCDSDLAIEYSESSEINADGIQEITRTWTATDDCGNAESASQLVTVLPCTNIGDTVWYDIDQDGIQDADESGVEGVTVNLIGPGLDGLFHTADDEIVDTQVTDENGNYLFLEVYPGDYCIEFVSSTIPTEYVFTSSNEGGDDAADSDADEDGKTEIFTVEPGQDDDLTFDAGIFNPINIGDTVFNDLNQDGIQDAGEPGVPGVTVNLIGPGPDGLFHTDDDEIVATEITDANGNYLFEEVAPGTYCIEFVSSTLPTGSQFTVADQGGDDAADSDADAEGKTEPFTLTAGQDDDLTFDAGIIDPINIGDTVFNDLDQDGIQDAGEPGVPGVTVNLIGPGPDGLFHTDDDEIVATEITDANGNYLFEEVAPGTYCIEFASSTLPTGSQFTDADQGGDDAADSDADADGKTEPFTLTAGQDDDLTFDAGIIDPINIGDTVFNDLDQDGIQDAGEPGVPGVTVNLIGPGPDGLFHTDDDEIVATEITDANGNYLFEEVAPETYCIEFVSSTLPTGTQFTDADQGGDDAADSDADADGKTEPFTLTAGQDDDLTFDAGIIDPINIGDTVFNDLDQDGIQDAGEPGVPGVTVNLIGPGPDGLFHTDDDEIVATEITDANGNYLFEEVAPGTYCIEFVSSTLPTGTQFTDADQGGDDAADSDSDADGKTEPFTVTAGQDDDLTFDAGIIDPINIGDTVFNDLDQDGIQDAGEPGVPGVTVNLIGPGPDGLFHTDDDEIVATEITDANGNYLFEEVAPGTYCIEFVSSTLPTGSQFTDADQGGDDAADSDADADGKTEPFTLTAGQDDDLTFDAGLIDPLNIGDTVFNDLDRDGIQDAGEPGVPGVTVNLIGPGPDGLFHTDDDEIVATEITDANGNYLFEEVAPGTYCIEFVSSTIPAGYEFTGTDVGGDDAADSDADADGKTEPFTLTAGQDDDLTFDAGIFNCTNIVIEDPILEDFSIECSEELPLPGVPNFVDPVDTDLAIVYSEASEQVGCTTVITRTWIATNDCGNTATESQIVTIIDTTIPVVESTPADLSLECDDVIPSEDATFSDNCDDDLTIVMEEASAGDDCTTTITRTWTATDDCGNMVSTSQVITITDSTAPTASNEPADVTIECNEDMPNDEPSFLDNCDEDLSVEMTEDSSEDGCSTTITRTWTATDDCGNMISVDQVITITDSTAPVASNEPDDVTINCDEEMPNDAPSFTDVCDSDLTIIFDEDNSGDICTAGLVRTWTATDDCGNATTVTQTITVIDNVAPTLNTPANAVVDCSTANIDPANTGNASAFDNCSGASVTYSDSPVEGSCPVTIIRTWTAVDGCGNTASDEQEITIIDETAPVLTVPADITIECTEDPMESVTGFANAIDACDDDVAIAHTDGPITGSCPYTFERTFTATDYCGNVSTGVQVISIDDTTDPIISNAPGDLNVDCDDNIPSDPATFTDNCDDDVEVTMDEQNVPLDCGYQLIRVYTATDDCGNTTSFTQTITITDVSAPILVGVPADATLNCDETPVVANVTADDNCDPSVTVVMTEVENGSGCDASITRTWTATDGCGNAVSESQTISFVDTTAPVISCPSDVTVNCETSNSTPDITGNATATDNCSGASVTYSDGPLSGNCPAAFVRTWTAVDGCGNASTCTQSITIIDENGPTLVLPDDITISCGESTAESNTGSASAFDACGGASVNYSDATTGDCPVIITRTYTGTDACGNTTVGSQLITIEDTASPVASNGPADITIQCEGGVPAADDVSFTDNCDADVIVVLTEVTNDLDCGFEVVRTWTGTDNCGNAGAFTQTISVTDNIAPEFSGVPADATVNCGDTPPAPANPTATDNCADDVVITFNEETSGSGCSVLIVRTWTATDECGNAATASQEITITDDVPPVLVGIPADVEVDCANIPEPTNVTATDNCDDDVTVSYYEEADFSECPYTITRHYTAIDACGNLAKDNQVITVTDNTAPSFGTYPTSITASCDVLESYVLLATDACDDDVMMSYSDNNFSGGCLGVIERTWVAEDNCGNIASAIQFITLYDDQAPVIEDAPSDITIDCGEAIPEAPVLIATDNCDSELEVVFTEVQNGTDCPYTITRTWTVVDDCANETIETQIISVLTGGFVPDAEIVTSPNPFNESTTVSFILPEDGFVLLEVYSSIGELVDVIYKGHALSGMYYEFNIDTHTWNSGMYHTKLIFEGEISSTKMLKSK